MVPLLGHGQHALISGYWYFRPKIRSNAIKLWNYNCPAPERLFSQARYLFLY